MGALLGALGAFLLAELGVPYVFGDLHTSAFVCGGLFLGAAIALVAGTLVVAWIDAVLVCVWLVIAFVPVMGHVAPRWVRRDPLPQRADALMILSGSLTTDSALTSDAFNRTISGLELAKAAQVPELVTSRVFRDSRAGRISSDSDQARLIRLADYTGHWDIVSPVHSTRDEAVQAAKLLLPSRSHLIVVTSPMHTRRACATFERVGFVVSCQPSREHENVTWHPESASDRLASFREYLYERLGMVKYRYTGWVVR